MLDRRDFDEWWARELARAPGLRPTTGEKYWADQGFMAAAALMSQSIRTQKHIDKQRAVSTSGYIRTVPSPLKVQPFPLLQDAADELDKSHQREREFSAQAARQVETAEGDDVTEFQLITMDENGDEDMVAGTSGARADALLEIMRYATSCTVPVTLYEVVRVPVDLSVMRMGHA